MKREATQIFKNAMIVKISQTNSIATAVMSTSSVITVTKSCELAAFYTISGT